MSKKSNMIDTESNPLLSVGSVAKMLGVTPATVRKWCDDKIIEYTLLPTGVRRIRKSQVDAILNDMKGNGEKNAI